MRAWFGKPSKNHDRKPDRALGVGLGLGMQKIASNYPEPFVFRPSVRLVVRVQVAYRTDMAEVLGILRDVAGRHPRVLRDPEPTAQVVNLADSGVDLELGFWIKDPERGSQNVRSDVSVSLLQELRARGIEIPFPQREVRLTGEGRT